MVTRTERAACHTVKRYSGLCARGKVFEVDVVGPWDEGDELASLKRRARAWELLEGSQ